MASMELEPTNIKAQERELAFRQDHGVAVQLIWNKVADKLSVLVNDVRTGEAFALPAERDKALDVFNHPYAYRTAGQLATAALFELEAA